MVRFLGVPLALRSLSREEIAGDVVSCVSLGVGVVGLLLKGVVCLLLTGVRGAGVALSFSLPPTPTDCNMLPMLILFRVSSAMDDTSVSNDELGVEQ